MSNYKLVPLCRCNNCMNIYEDSNPQADAARFRIPESIDELMKDDNSRVCPECKTDEYLSDVGLVVNLIANKG